MISVIILAAGESKRMGETKQLMPLDNSTIIERTIDNFLGADVAEIILVTGYKSLDIATAVAKRPVKIVVNPDYSKGMSTSITAGLNQIDDRSQAIMIALADQPEYNHYRSEVLKFLYERQHNPADESHTSKHGTEPEKVLEESTETKKSLAGEDKAA